MEDPGGTLRLSALDVEPMTSYAANYEDVRLRRVAGLLRNRRYVDVGAGDAIDGSTTYWLYTQGWRGVLVEPGARGALLEEHRPGDLVIAALVGSGGGDAVLYESSPDAGMSTMRADRLDELLAMGQTVRERIVPVLMLTAVFAQAGGPVDILSVDVEGAEADVLGSLDWEQHRPAVVVVEAILPWRAVSTTEEWSSHLLGAEYRQAAFDGVNCFFVDTRHPDAPELESALSYPVSSLDRFVPWATVRTQHELEDLSEQLEAAGQRAEALAVELTEAYGSRSVRKAALFARRVHRSRYTHRLRKLRHPKEFGRAVAKKLRTGAAARFVGQDRRRQLATRSTTHNSFLQPRAPVVYGPPGASSWHELASSQARDDDSGLRARLEARAGVRSDTERDVQVAALAEQGTGPPRERNAERTLCVVDARALQDPQFALRGIGVYARQLVEAVCATWDGDVALLVDERLPALPTPSGQARTLTQIDRLTAARTRWLLQPSPMTAPAWPLAPLLSDAAVCRTSMVYDAIPLRHPSVYAPDAEAQVRNAARWQTLRLYDELWSISHETAADVEGVASPESVRRVVWPTWDDARPSVRSTPTRRVLIAAGNEPRKNVASGLAAVALVRRSRPDLRAAVVGWGGETDAIVQLAEDVGLPRYALEMLPYLDDADLADERAAADAVLVPSYDEGLSLPVIETLLAGRPVVASDIAAHRELLGTGPWLGSPAAAAELATALEYVLAHPDVVGRQQEALSRHEHVDVATAVRDTAGRLASRNRRLTTPGAARPRPVVAVVTPWPPQRSGIADYSAATLPAITDRADLRLLLTPSTDAPSDVEVRPPWLADPKLGEEDVLLTVLGNSHFHLPGLELVETYGGVALCHDVRLTELNSYIGLSDPVGTRQQRDRGRRTLRHELDAIPTLGYQHVAKRCELLLFHSARTAARVAAETGASTATLPFVPYRLPHAEELTEGGRAAARARTNMAEGVHLGLLGGVDVRTKAADVVVEAAAWLRQWGLPVVLHIVGGVEAHDRSVLERAAAQADMTPYTRWHGHVSDATYRDILLSVDLGVQLRSAAVLSLSGGAADLAAFGVPSVATRALAEDMQLPPMILPVDDDFSPLLVAEQLAQAMDRGRDEEGRQTYVDAHSPRTYADQLLHHLGLV